MYLATNPTVLLPHEMNQIEQIFGEVLRERGLTRQCKSAQAIAKRLMDLYLSGVRESVALRYLAYLDEPVASRPWQNARPLVEEVSMLHILREKGLRSARMSSTCFNGPSIEYASGAVSRATASAPIG